MPILKLSLRAWRSAPLSQLGAVLISSTLLLSVGMLLSIDLSIGSAALRIRHEQRVTTYLSAGLSEKDEAALVDTIRISLGAHSESDVRAKLVGVEESLNHLKDSHPGLHRELQGLGEEARSLVPRAVHATGYFEEDAMASAVASVRKISGVDSVETTETRAAVLAPAVRVLQWLVRFIGLGVATAWILAWLALARSHAAGLAGVLSPLRLWGAGTWTSRAPGILSGLWVGIPAGLIAAAIHLLVVVPVLGRLSATSSLFEVVNLPGLGGAAALFLTSVLAGASAGALSGSAEA